MANGGAPTSAGLRIAALDTTSPKYRKTLTQCLGETEAAMIEAHAADMKVHYITIAMIPGTKPLYTRLIEMCNTIEELTDAVLRHYLLFNREYRTGMPSTFCTICPRLEPSDRDFLYKAMDRVSDELLAMADAQGSA
jgi:hypothetical protein